jgi:hypothetical protein
VPRRIPLARKVAEELSGQSLYAASPYLLFSLNRRQRLGSNVQTLTTPELMFRALLTEDGTELIELARPSIGHPNLYTLTHVHAAPLGIVGGLKETIGLTAGIW